MKDKKLWLIVASQFTGATEGRGNPHMRHSVIACHRDMQENIDLVGYELDDVTSYATRDIIKSAACDFGKRAGIFVHWITLDDTGCEWFAIPHTVPRALRTEELVALAAGSIEIEWSDSEGILP